MQDLDACLTGRPQPAVSDGYWVMLAPLSPGEHTLRFGGAFPGFRTDATWHLTVVPGGRGSR